MSARFLKANTLSTYIDVSTALGYRTMSVCFWANPSALADQEPFDKTPSTGTLGWSIRMRSNGDLQVHIGVGTGYSVTFASAYAAATLAHWVIVIIIGGTPPSANTCEIYVYKNGVEFGHSTATACSTSDSAEISTALRIARSYGNQIDDSGNNFDGNLDDVRIYNRTLAADEVLTIFSCNGHDGIVYGLQLWYQFLEGKPALAMAAGGGAVGTLTFSSSTPPTFVANSLFNVKIPSATADKLILSTSGVALDVRNLTLTIDIIGLSSPVSGVIIAQTNAGTITGPFASVPTNVGIYTVTIHYNATTITVDLT